ncbi:Alanyl-tRNA synthetase [Hordeum vulgare]|nr:Alanyl-tRNA synthetase [Hordeum vulgare]
MAKYWWSSSVDRRSLHWLSWDALSEPKGRGGMGFRDLESFNLALLGKHGWRLMTDPTSLCARVLKGRYYPRGDFMHATVPKSSSATWRAIIEGRKVLQLGLIKRVGAGSTISIWDDCWIPSLPAMKPARSDNHKLRQVSELIDPYTGTWNIDLVRQVFPTVEADAILNIPLRSEGGEDVLAWAPEKSGLYSVKTAYRSLMTQIELRAREEGKVTTTPLSEQQMWARLWKLKVLPKVRVFWWRVLRGILPLESVLKHRHISNDSACKLCLNPDETLRHALLECFHARKFWDIAPNWLEVSRPDVNPQTWKIDILCDQRYSESERAKLVSIMWSIWTSHNNITHDRGPVSPSQSMIWTRDALAILDIPRNQALTLPGHGWRPPDQGTIKINTDGSIASQYSRGGGGGVARSQQAFIAAWCKPFDGVIDPLVAEALALREGVRFARLQGFSRVVLETDSLELVQLWLLRDNSRSVVAPIMDEIGENVAFFSSFCIQHCNRAANTPAHLCAKHASTHRGDRVLDAHAT